MRIEKEDLSYATVDRRQFRIFLEARPIAEDSYLEIARRLVSEEPAGFAAISFLFYEPGSNQLEDLADVVVDFAPGGDWNLAGDSEEPLEYRVRYPKKIGA